MPVDYTTSTRLRCVVAGVFALALAACGAGEGGDPFSGEVVRIGDAVAAEVDGTPIYISDVKREAMNQGLVAAADPLDPDSPRFAEVLDDLVHRRVIALEARREGLHDTQEARRRVAAAREVILYNIYLETKIDDAVTEEALRALFEEQVKLRPLGDEVRARHILVNTAEEAAEIAELARQEGADFRQIALTRSMDETTRLEGGDLDYFGRGRLSLPELEDAAFETPVGAVSNPVQTQLGWHVLKIEDRRAEEPPSFEEMRPQMRDFLMYQELQNLSDILEAKADVQRLTGGRR